MEGWPVGQVLRIATIIDEIDGKHKVNAHKGLGHIIDVLKSDKHSGQFDHECISLYADVFVKGHTPSAKTGKASFTPNLRFKAVIIILPPLGKIYNLKRFGRPVTDDQC